MLPQILSSVDKRTCHLLLLSPANVSSKCPRGFGKLPLQLEQRLSSLAKSASLRQLQIKYS